MKNFKSPFQDLLEILLAMCIEFNQFKKYLFEAPSAYVKKKSTLKFLIIMDNI